MDSLPVLVIRIHQMLDLMLLNRALYQGENFIRHIKVLFFSLYFSEMPAQADLLIARMKNELGARFNTEWKLVTFFIGANDLCSVCKDAVRICHLQ